MRSQSFGKKNHDTISIPASATWSLVLQHTFANAGTRTFSKLDRIAGKDTSKTTEHAERSNRLNAAAHNQGWNGANGRTKQKKERESEDYKESGEYEVGWRE